MTVPPELPLGTPLLVVNPRAGRGDEQVLDRLVAALLALGVQPDVARTTRAGDAGPMAREAVLGGRRLVVAVGGDGTVNEILNGLVDAETGEVSGEPVLGIVGNGSGCDLARTFGLDRSPERLADHLVTADTMTIDVGRAWTIQPDGASRPRLFANIAEAGYGGTVTRLANRLPRRVGRARYAAAIALALPSFRRAMTTVTFDGGNVSEPVCNVLVANAQFYGGGLQVAPRALPTDGRFNLQTWGGRPLDVVLAQRQLRDGSHLRRDDVREWQSSAVTIDADRPLRVEADGEVFGTTPARFEVLPRVLQLKL